MIASAKKKRRSSRRTKRRRAPRYTPVVELDPEAPGLDEETRARRRALAKMQDMSPQEFFQCLVRAGIYTEDGELTAPYRSKEPCVYRPKLTW